MRKIMNFISKSIDSIIILLFVYIDISNSINETESICLYIIFSFILIINIINRYIFNNIR